MKYCPMTRRMFLRGAGGTLLAMPFLGSLAPRAHAQTLPQMRFAMMMHTLGRDMSQWYPNLPDSAFQNVNGVLVKPFTDIAKPVSYCLNSAFNPILNKMTLIRGLDCMSTNGMHNSAVPTTGSSFEPSSDTGFGYSIDAILEESPKFYGVMPRVGAIRTAPNPGGHSYSDFQSYSFTSKIARGQKINSEWNPMAIYNNYLNTKSSMAIGARNTQIRRTSNAVFENFKQILNGRAIAAEDKVRLDSYMAYMADIDRQMANPVVGCGLAADPGSPTSITEIHKAMIRMEVAALACGSTKIVMHSIVQSGNIPDELWHQWAHAGEYEINPSTGRSYLSEYCKFNMDLVAYFLTELDKIQEANGTLLDNTLFLYGNEDGTGSHEHVDLPVMVAGAKGKFKTGYYIDYRQRPFVNLLGQERDRAKLYAGRPYNSMLVSVAKALGLNESDYQKFGVTGFGRTNAPFNGMSKAYTQFTGATINNPLPFLYL